MWVHAAEHVRTSQKWAPCCSINHACYNSPPYSKKDRQLWRPVASCTKTRLVMLSPAKISKYIQMILKFWLENIWLASFSCVTHTRPPEFPALFRIGLYIGALWSGRANFASLKMMDVISIWDFEVANMPGGTLLGHPACINL